jgi:hypothetical protein
MSRKRPYIGPSDAQANADALARRGLPYSAASQVSFTVKWDWHRREPVDLREACRMVRKAYSDEVPTKLHDGPDAIGPDGTPRMSAQAEGYIFGRADASDVRATEDDPVMVSYLLTPFRATLAEMERGDPCNRRRARMIAHMTFGSMGPAEAAITEQAHPMDAKDVAELALRAFLRRLSDMRLNVPQEAIA